MIVSPGQADWTLRTNIDNVAKIIQAIDNYRVKDAFDSATRAAPAGTTPAPPLPREAEVLPGATEAEAQAVAPSQLIMQGGMSPEQYKGIRWNQQMRQQLAEAQYQQKLTKRSLALQARDGGSAGREASALTGEALDMEDRPRRFFCENRFSRVIERLGPDTPQEVVVWMQERFLELRQQQRDQKFLTKRDWSDHQFEDGESGNEAALDRFAEELAELIAQSDGGLGDTEVLGSAIDLAGAYKKN